jgi:signal transduction histidine kinase
MKWRLLAAFAGLVAIVLLAQDIPLASYLRDTERDRLLASLERDAFIIAGNSEDLLSGEIPAETADNLQSTVRQYAARDGGRVVVTDADGEVVAASDPTDVPGDDFSNRPEIAAALTGQPAAGERDSSVGPLVYVAVPVISGGTTVGAVRITFPASVIDERADDKTRGLILVGAISLLGAAVAAFFVATTITSPLRRLERSTERLAAGDFAARADTTEGPPEVRGLAVSFNSMTERISRLLDQQRAFAGDASHQLRTPLTALRLRLERAGALIDTDPDAARADMEAAGEETERLQRLVEGLLMMARSEGTTPATSVVDVTAGVRDRAEVWAPFAEERGVHLRTAVSDGLLATTVPDALEQIVDNYVDNALAMAEPGDTVAIEASRHGDRVTLHVIDEGPGMDPDHLARAFDRFWRAPDAPHGGSGIGLAIVRHLAELSGGSAALQNRTDRPGLDASVELPTA